MKYEAPIHRTEIKHVQVFAASRDEALRRVREGNPGFTADHLMELGEGDEPGANHEVAGACESCDKILWDGDRYVIDEEGLQFCAVCEILLKP